MNRCKAQITVIDRESQKPFVEKVAGLRLLQVLYPSSKLLYFLSASLLQPIIRLSFISALYGAWQKSPLSKKKIVPFIQSFQIDSSEFEDKVDSFSCFNDFFIRKLNKKARPFEIEPSQAITFADGRYLAFPNLSIKAKLQIKGQSFQLEELLQDKNLASEYNGGSLVIARLCPVDYHRFHLPFDCTLTPPKLLNGFYLSVNPLALSKKLSILWENKRYLSQLHSPIFGKVLWLEIGATNVGTVYHHQLSSGKKGEEKGYFSFGGSCLITIFPPKSIQLDKDLTQASAKGLETYCKWGQSLGKAH